MEEPIKQSLRDKLDEAKDHIVLAEKFILDIVLAEESILEAAIMAGHVGALSQIVEILADVNSANIKIGEIIKGLEDKYGHKRNGEMLYGTSLDKGSDKGSA